MKDYQPNVIEPKWQKTWEKDGLYVTDTSSKLPPFYNLWMFPYPSAEGLHAGHAYASTGSDIYGRLKRMQGYEVFQPIGYDSFGIHSENFAIKIGETPQTMLARTTKNYERQLRNLGHGYDWTRTVTTSNPDYYRWTQWLFVQMFKSGLAYRKKAEVNWCPGCKTVLADEQIVSPAAAGKWPSKYANLEAIPAEVKVCERCGSEPERKELVQWFFRITDYADRLLANLEKIDWPEKIKLAQKNWIGKKTGLNIRYEIEGGGEVTVFTTRPDTNFGATFVVVAPEHQLAVETAKDSPEVAEYINRAKNISFEDRTMQGRKKTGVFLGKYAVNSLNGERLPVWVSDFVLMNFGTGAVVGVPGHDLRDFEFAKEMNLPIKRVVAGPDGVNGPVDDKQKVWEGEGRMVNSQILDGMTTDEAMEKVSQILENTGHGSREVNYHLRDWLISRQRYWGPPIPMIYCPSCAQNGKSFFTTNKPKIHASQLDWDHAGWYPESEQKLPVQLPEIQNYQPDGQGRGPLAKHPEFYKTSCPVCGNEAERETDVSDTFLDSAWYFLRYPSVASVTANQRPFDPEITRKWLPVSLYFGGAEHAVLHLMYCRFITMVLSDLGEVKFEEPAPRFFAHGLMIKDGAKMSKSRGNVVNPDQYITKYGTDAFRLYLMFIGPMDGSPDFRDTGMEGMARFISRLWRLKTDNDENKSLNKALNKLVGKLTFQLENYKYNTAIAAVMEFINQVEDGGGTMGYEQAKVFWKLMAPLTPHLAEEKWEELGGKNSIHKQEWPKEDKSALDEEKVIVIVQVNGKLRDRLEVSQKEAIDEEVVRQLAWKNPKISLEIGKKQTRTVFVPGKLLNLVV